MKTTLAAGLGCLAACLFAAPIQAQAPERLSTDPAVSAMVRDASSRIMRAAAGMGYDKHAHYLRAIAVESDARRSIGTMSRIGVARINARFVRATGLTREDIAWVVAHEFAHFILNHPARRAVVAHAYEGGTRERSAANQALELEADRLGLQLVTAAGFAFDPQAFFTRLRKGRLAGESASHPADGVRIQVMQSAARGAS
jgi:predicted Zn-dependent protease